MSQEMEDATKNAQAAGAGSIPKGLEKFAGADGALDVAKLSQSYLEVEKKATDESQRRSAAEKSYASLAESLSGGAGGDDAGGDDDAGAGGDDADAGRSTDASKKTTVPAVFTRQEAVPLVQSFIAMVHPEVAIDPKTNDFANKEFIAGLKKYVSGLPMAVKQSIAQFDYTATDWAIRQYKALQGAGVAARSGGGSGAGTGAGQKVQFLEGGSTGGTGEGKSWTHAEIRELHLHNPKEYAKQADEISKAFEEGRVKD